ncbi:hypothetical protein [Haloferula sp. BvORR071]|uniref:hypothetical protein n=1 Tax=Haloferula sp. BvORR071 TaxID=1396141 RepID=UPI0005543065|nr:hypothetical protein [Haloferula sp. BvORR071]
MAATQTGIAPKHGITSAETGLIVNSISYNWIQESYPTKNHQGETVGMTFLDERATIKIQGWIPTSSAFSGNIAGTLVMANTMPDHFKGTATGGTYLIDEISREASNEGAETIEISATYWPFIS